MKPTLIVTAAIAVVLASPAGASADEIRVWTARAIATVLAEIGPEFERGTGHRLIVTSDLPPAFLRRLDAGESVDLLISGSSPVDEWIQNGKIAAHTRADIARSGAGAEGGQRAHQVPGRTEGDRCHQGPGDGAALGGRSTSRGTRPVANAR
jgi:molybdate transport system substrate-binding protein